MLTEKMLNPNPHTLIIKKASCAEPLQDLIENISRIRKSDKKCVLQVFDPRAIATREHLIASYIEAKISFSEKTARAGDPSMEMLLFAAMTRQISAAIKIAGAKNSEEFILFTDSKPAFERLRSMLTSETEFNPSEKDALAVARRLGIKVGRFASLTDFLLERIALSRLEQ